MLKFAVLVLLFATFITSKVKVTQGTLQHTCSDILSYFDQCWEFEHCQYYQVNQQYTGYGCGMCNNYYEAQFDENGVGYCLINPNSVKNCLWPVNYSGTSYCSVCEPNYSLGQDNKSCTPRPKNSDIANCLYYALDPRGGIHCEICRPGYTVIDNFTSCVKGCSIENCQDCAVYRGNLLCFACMPGTIGVWNPVSNAFDSCITCEAYQCGLLYSEAKQCCLDQLSQC